MFHAHKQCGIQTTFLRKQNNASVHNECRKNIMNICEPMNADEAHDIDGIVIMAKCRILDRIQNYG
jgi:hypothetical protein